MIILAETVQEDTEKLNFLELKAEVAIGEVDENIIANVNKLLGEV